MRFLREIKRGSTKFLILSLLKEKEMYGYELLKEIEKKSGGYFKLDEGTLYPALHSLEKDGFIVSSWRKSQKEGLPDRKYYSITKKGIKFFEETSKEWNQFAKNLSQFLFTRTVSNKIIDHKYIHEMKTFKVMSL
ncbi:MAG: PadR family transcriptional regulator [Acidobacteriota bacterium]